MERVWLSTTYYLDPKLAGCTANTERMFSRLIAYCGNAETGGYIPGNAHKLVGLPNGNRSILDLKSRGILLEMPDGGYRFAGWSNWNDQADKLVQRKKSERERQRRKRERDADMSRDMSRDVTPPEERRGEENSKEFSKSPLVSDANESEELPRGKPVDVDGWKLVRSVISTEHSTAARTALSQEAGAMLKAGTPADDVRATLELWLTKPGLGPRVLPHLLSDVIRGRSAPPSGTLTAYGGATALPPGVGKPTLKAMGWQAAGEELIRKRRESQQS